LCGVASIRWTRGYPPPATDGIDEWGADRLLKMARAVNGSSYLLLAYLLSISADHIQSADIFPKEVVLFALLVNRALDPPTDHTSLPLMWFLIDLIQQIKAKMQEPAANGPSSLIEMISARATKLLIRLSNYLAIMQVSGQRNSRALFCARSKQMNSPAIGWLAPYTD